MQHGFMSSFASSTPRVVVMFPFARRDFLRAGSCLLANAAIASKLTAAGDPAFTFAVITDTHLGRQMSNTPTRLMKLAVAKVNEISRRQRDPGRYEEHCHLGETGE